VLFRVIQFLQAFQMQLPFFCTLAGKLTIFRPITAVFSPSATSEVLTLIASFVFSVNWLKSKDYRKKTHNKLHQRLSSIYIYFILRLKLILHLKLNHTHTPANIFSPLVIWQLLHRHRNHSVDVILTSSTDTYMKRCRNLLDGSKLVLMNTHFANF